MSDLGRKLRQSITLSKSPAAAPARTPPAKAPPKASPLARDPALSAYINTKALGRPEVRDQGGKLPDAGPPHPPAGRTRSPLAACTARTQGQRFQELHRALFDSINGDKTARQQLYGLLLRLFFYEELPPDVITQLVPLLQARARRAAPGARQRG